MKPIIWFICQTLATEHSFNISFMRRIENEEFNRIRNTLLTLGRFYG